MRKSMEDIKHMVKKIEYTGVLPEELKEYHYYISDAGHSIMCVLKCHLADARFYGMDDYEVPVPVKYVIEKGYQIENGYVIVEAKYELPFGLAVDEKYAEF